MADDRDMHSPDSWETIQSGVREIEHLIGQQKYNEAMIRAKETLEFMVDTLCRQEGIREGSLIERIDELENRGVINKTTYERYNKIRMIGSKAQHDKSNSAYEANQAHHLLSEEVYTFATGDAAKKSTASRRPRFRQEENTRPVRLAADKSERDNRFEREARRQRTVRPVKKDEEDVLEINDEDKSAAPEEKKATEKDEPDAEAAERKPESPEETKEDAASAVPADAEEESSESVSKTENAERPRRHQVRDAGISRPERVTMGRKSSYRRRAMSDGPSFDLATIIKPILLIAIIIVLIVIIWLLRPTGDTGGDSAETTAAETTLEETADSSAGDESAESQESGESAESAESADATAAETQVSTEKYQVKADAQTVRVRSTPNTDDDTNIVGLLASGESVEYVGDQDDQWAIIIYNGEQAYVAKQYIEKAQ